MMYISRVGSHTGMYNYITGRFPHRDVCITGRFPHSDVCATGRFLRSDVCATGRFPHSDVCATGRCPRSDVCATGRFTHSDVCATGRFPHSDVCATGRFPHTCSVGSNERPNQDALSSSQTLQRFIDYEWDSLVDYKSFFFLVFSVLSLIKRFNWIMKLKACKSLFHCLILTVLSCISIMSLSNTVLN